jgi:AraC-like DNA-binding protein
LYDLPIPNTPDGDGSRSRSWRKVLRIVALGDVRKWMPTEREGESIAIGRPLPWLEVMSVRGSQRHWCESLHETFTVAAVRRDPHPSGAEWRTRGRSLVTVGGQLMCIQAGDGHQTIRVPAPSAFDAIKLTPSWLHEAAAGLGAMAFRFASPSSNSRRVFDAVEELVRTVARGALPLETEAACHGVVAAMVRELVESPVAEPRMGEGKRAVHDRRLRRVRELLIDGGRSRPTLDELERESGLGTSQLYARFKGAYGTSIGQFWIGCRVAKARSLLLQGMPAAEVAAELGFADQQHFSRAFRDHHGLPPAAWASLYRRNTRG